MRIWLRKVVFAFKLVKEEIYRDTYAGTCIHDNICVYGMKFPDTKL